MRKTYIKKQENKSGHPSPEEINESNEIELERISRSKVFDDFYEFTDKAVSFILRTTVFFFKISGVYILWIGLHYFSAHLYVKFCVPNSVIGFIMSPFMITTPHCQGLRWIVYNAANIINHMWILIGAWIYSMIWITGAEQTRET
jgi:hypothetical protein